MVRDMNENYFRKVKIRRIFGILAILLIIGLACCVAMFLKIDGFDKAAIIIFAGIPFVGITCALLFFGEQFYSKKEEYIAYYDRRISFLKLSVVWLIIHYWLIGLSFFAPAFLSIIAAYHDELESYKIALYSLISIFGTLLNFILNPKSQAYGFRIASELLDSKLSMIDDLGDDANEILRLALKSGEKYITHATFGSFDTDCDKEN